MEAKTLAVGKPYNNTMVEITEPGDSPGHDRLVGTATSRYAGLFAAAPELLTALQDILLDIAANNSNGLTVKSANRWASVEKARAAIAKATK